MITYKVTIITQQELNELFNSQHVLVVSNPYRGKHNSKREKEKKRVKEKKERQVKLKPSTKTYQRVK